MFNPFERHYSPTPEEKEKAREKGGEEAVADLEGEYDGVTEAAKEPDVVEISQEEVDNLSNPEEMDKLIKSFKNSPEKKE